MPVPGFLQSFADKAQSAIKDSPLAQHLPSQYRPGSPDASAQPSANEVASGGHKSHTLEAIQYQLRSLGQQYSSTSPVQKIITIEKGVAIDFDSVSRDSKAQSKELYTWGQSELDDLKDVTDRLAYLNFVQGSLASSIAVKLDAARAPLKQLRDAEVALTPRRNIRAGLQNQLARLEHDNQKGMEKKISELKDQVRKAEADDQPQEREVELLKRKAIRESEQAKWDAIREYGEKLILLSQAANPVIAVLPTIPPTESSPYTGAQATGAARASLQRALDNYKTGHINLPPQVAASDLSRSDTQSFGESHASELSSMSTDVAGAASPGIPLSPPLNATKDSSQAVSEPTKYAPPSSPPPINPSNLNLSPTPLPSSGGPSSASPSVSSVPSDSSKLPPITPTIAETGVPVSAGTSGPGPASGSLHDIKASPPSGGNGKFESAEEEKRRLAATYSQAYNAPPVSQPTTSTSESAEEEKKRLERERILKEGGSHGPTGSGDNNTRKDDDELPPYQDI
ncbi:Eisosome component PIL1-domain-containing protein [Desarmillaria tabescens]|uniref:Eisosome component PIL1-domain-containing protein n=1 Tax=Armillaria tabescens TaxID=1929756 RepID=A0AA39NGB8_ARMTA|nr:Eisosome component PIL1-domain-containing protein [Desarmillaria tabescens]KAK0465121.1 Eisosome component PIL1-domain-containing protein [Desarmillaria tabescens]